MTWREPNEFERAILADVKASWPKEIIVLARCLALAPRIEPLLLRNARLNFVPQAQAEAESLLWFSPPDAGWDLQSRPGRYGQASHLP